MSNDERGEMAPQQAETSPSVSPSRNAGMGAMAGVVWALLGGAIAWGLIARFDPYFTLPEELRDVSIYSPPDKIAAANAARELANLRNSLAILTLLGGLLGGLMALGDGVSRRSVLRAASGLVLVAVIGAGATGLGGWLGLLAMNRYGEVTVDNELFRTTIVHAWMMTTAGTGIGLGIGLFRGRWGDMASAVCGGVLGGVLAAIIYPIAAAQFLPEAITETLIPRGMVNRGLWIGLFALLLGVTIPGMQFKRTPAEPK